MSRSWCWDDERGPVLVSPMTPEYAIEVQRVDRIIARACRIMRCGPQDLAARVRELVEATS